MRIYHVFKRIIDVIFSLIGIIFLIPLFIILAIWIKTTSKGPVIYKHRRIGKNGKPFTIYKFRTMVVGARDMQKKKIPNKNLITSPGKFLRRCFLDETLQLFNIFKGDMSLVGPRPLDKETFDGLIKQDKKWNDIIEIKPGLTSVESVADYLSRKEMIEFEKHFKGLLKKDTNQEGYFKHRLILDGYYVKNKSFLLDAKILLYTILLISKKIFSKK